MNMRPFYKLFGNKWQRFNFEQFRHGDILKPHGMTANSRFIVIKKILLKGVNNNVLRCKQITKGVHI